MPREVAPDLCQALQVGTPPQHPCEYSKAIDNPFIAHKTGDAGWCERVLLCLHTLIVGVFPPIDPVARRMEIEHATAADPMGTVGLPDFTTA